MVWVREIWEVNPQSQKTIFKVPRMDCSSEETLIRMKLQAFPEVKGMEFDLPERLLSVYHDGRRDQILDAICELNLGGSIVSTEEIEEIPTSDDGKQKRLLWAVLLINFVFFLLEMSFGLLSHSMGLVADSLDMLADSLVYALALFAVGAAVSRKKMVARVAGWFQISLAVLGIVEVVRRFLEAEGSPDFMTMMIVSTLALAANGVCLYLLQKTKSAEAHMQASMIFTSNDVIINLGVIVAGLLVYLTDSQLPDLVVGIVVFVLVLLGARRATFPVGLYIVLRNPIPWTNFSGNWLVWMRALSRIPIASGDANTVAAAGACSSLVCSVQFPGRICFG